MRSYAPAIAFVSVVVALILCIAVISRLEQRNHERYQERKQLVERAYPEIKGYWAQIGEIDRKLKQAERILDSRTYREVEKRGMAKRDSLSELISSKYAAYDARIVASF